MPRTRTEEKKTSILKAATRVFSEKDFHEAAIEDVAEAAGVGKGTLYRYFETKDDLYTATVLAGFQEAYDALRRALPMEPDPARRLALIAGEILATFWDRCALYAMMHRDPHGREPHGRLRKARARLVGMVEDAISAGLADGRFHDVEPHVGAEFFMGMIRGSLFNLRDSERVETLAPKIVRVFLRGVSRRRPA